MTPSSGEMHPEGHTTFQPNRLILEAAHRAAVDCFGSVAGFRLSLRPARRYLFPDPPDVRSLQVELRKPAFGVLVRHDDPEARVELVIETEPVSPGIRSLYRAAGTPLVTVKCRLGACQLIYERDGFYGDLRPTESLLDRTVHFVLDCARQGRWCGVLVRSDVERRIAQTLGEIAPQLDCVVHHRVPFGYAVGYRPDLPGRAARQTIELLLGLDPRYSQCAEAVLPIRIETRPVEARGDEVSQLDEEVAAFAMRAGIPMVAVERTSRGEYAVTCSMDGIEECRIPEDDAQGWARYFDGACRAALERVRSCQRATEAQHPG